MKTENEKTYDVGQRRVRVRYFAWRGKEEHKCRRDTTTARLQFHLYHFLLWEAQLVDEGEECKRSTQPNTNTVLAF